MIHIYCTYPVQQDFGKYCLFPLLEPFLQPHVLHNHEAKPVSPVWQSQYTVVHSPQEADVFILPVDVAWYFAYNRVSEVEAFVELAKQYSKPCWMFSGGDYGITWPDEYVQQLRMASNKSRNQGNLFVMPPFIPDPLGEYNNQAEWSSQPSIGFCGQSNGSLLAKWQDYLRWALKWTKKRVGRFEHDLQPLQSTSYLRAHVLQELAKSKDLATHFLTFQQYKAGISNAADMVPAKLRYVKNIVDNHYTVCVRGAGNYSIRFYDCLAAGRIPILLDTDTEMPLASLIDWGKHLIRILPGDEAHWVKSILHFHQQHTERSFQTLQQENRRLWQEKLTYDGFFAHFHLLPPNQSFAHLYA